MRDRPTRLPPLRLVLAQSLLVIPLIFSGCATQSSNQPSAAAEEENFHDPLENANRKIFDFNEFID